jgi:hypothetical protein
MKAYPSIPRSTGMTFQEIPNAYVFDKPCSSGKRLAVDHDHATKKVRGLLCRRCNRGLGHFPTIALLRSALAYAESHQC